MYADSHCHLFDSRLDAVQASMIARARDAGVTQMLVCALPQELPPAVPIPIRVAVGLHPVWLCSVDVAQRESRFREVVSLASQRDLTAIGEFGFDKRFADRVAAHDQGLWVQRHLKLAQTHALPVVLHVVGMHKHMLDTLDTFPNVRGVVHGFSGSLEIANEYVKRGFYIGISGMLCRGTTRKLRRVAEELPLSSLLIETDSPDQHPQGHGLNEPGNLVQVAEVLAQVRGTSLAEVASATMKNYCDVFSVRQ